MRKNVKEPPKGIGRLALTALTQTLQAVLSILLVVYFLGASNPGRAMVTSLAQEEIMGEAKVGGIALDPATQSLALYGIELTDADHRPAVKLGAVAVDLESLADRHLEKLSLAEAEVLIALDDRWQVNLARFLRPKPPRPKKKPRPFRVDHLTLADSTIRLETPVADLDVGPVDLQGHVIGRGGQFPDGELSTRIEAIQFQPHEPVTRDAVRGLLGTDGPYRFGPWHGRIGLADGRLRVDDMVFSFPGVQAHLAAQVGLLDLTGQLSVTVDSNGSKAGGFMVRLDPQGFALSLLVNFMRLPGARGETLCLPPVEVNGFSFNARPEHFALKLNRLSLEYLDLGNVSATGVSLNGSLDFEPRTPLDDLVEATAPASVWETLTLASEQWQEGELGLSLLVDRVSVGGLELARPLRLRVAGTPGDQPEVRLTARLALSPHGTARGEAVVHTGGKERKTPYEAWLHIKDLETTPILALFDLPGMLKGMLKGRLSGKIGLEADYLGAPVIRVRECTFLLEREAGDLTFSIPSGEQVWDFSVDPEFSFFKKEIRFGEGRLLMSVETRTKRDG